MEKIRQEYKDVILDITMNTKGNLHSIAIFEKHSSKRIYSLTKKNLAMLENKDDVMMLIEFIIFNYNMGTLDTILNK